MIELRIVTNAEDRPQELSSREIADLCGKRHSVVMRGIRSTLAQVSIDARKFEGIDLDARNREKPCYYLPRLECSLVVSGYSVKRQMALRQRRQEIEERWERKTRPATPQTFVEALQLAATAQLEIEAKD